MQHHIDLNSDLGEYSDAASIARDRQLLSIVTSANIACGGHAGDSTSIARTIEAAMAMGVAIGAHPSYPDRENFGRLEMILPIDALLDSVIRQIEAVVQIAEQSGAALSHVKPHGALYHAADSNRDVAEAISQATGRFTRSAYLVGRSGGNAVLWWQSLGWKTLSEGFIDRRYTESGALMPRSGRAALIESPAEAVEQAIALVHQKPLRIGPAQLAIPAVQTLCVHSDTPNAVSIATAAKVALKAAGITVAAPKH